LINEVGSLFGILKYVCNIVVKKVTFAILSLDEFLFAHCARFAVACRHRN